MLLWVNNHFNDFETQPAMSEFLEKFEQLLEKEVSDHRLPVDLVLGMNSAWSVSARESLF